MAVDHTYNFSFLFCWLSPAGPYQSGGNAEASATKGRIAIQCLTFRLLQWLRASSSLKIIIISIVVTIVIIVIIVIIIVTVVIIVAIVIVRFPRG